MSVPCGKCIECKRRKREDWTFRIHQEYKNAESAYFITLTYNDLDVPKTESGNLTLKKRDLQLFFKSLRVSLQRSEDNVLNCPQNAKLRYYLVGEYGDQTHRPHYHILLFNLPGFSHSIKGYRALKRFLEAAWIKGFVEIGKIEPASIHYVTGYSLVLDEYNDEFDDRQRPFNLMSKGIGKQYLTEQAKQFHNSAKAGYLAFQGHKVAMPRYYKDRIFNPYEREQMSYTNGLQAFDKEVKEFEDLTSRGINPRTYAQTVKQQAIERAKAYKRKQRM